MSRYSNSAGYGKGTNHKSYGYNNNHGHSSSINQGYNVNQYAYNNNHGHLNSNNQGFNANHGKIIGQPRYANQTSHNPSSNNNYMQDINDRSNNQQFAGKKPEIKKRTWILECFHFFLSKSNALFEEFLQ